MDDTVSLSPLGRIVAKTWEEIPLHFPNAAPLAFVIMPNHVHGVILLSREGGVPPTIPVVGDFQPRGNPDHDTELQASRYVGGIAGWPRRPSLAAWLLRPDPSRRG
jgi:hypothetical protein